RPRERPGELADRRQDGGASGLVGDRRHRLRRARRRDLRRTQGRWHLRVDGPRRRGPAASVAARAAALVVAELTAFFCRPTVAAEIAAWSSFARKARSTEVTDGRDSRTAA